MKVSIAKTFDFDAAHFLPQMPEGHKCRRLHGHTYRVEIRVTGSVGKDGVIMDYALIEAAWRPLHEMLDHRDLNQIFEDPTTENVAIRIFNELQEAIPVDRVRVYESSTTYAEVSRAEVSRA